MDTVFSILQDLERLTLEQRGLIALDDKSALELNLAQKDLLLDKLAAFPDAAANEESRALLDRIDRLEHENILQLRAEMTRLRDLLKRAKEGMTTVRGYDNLTASVGATFMDLKK